MRAKITRWKALLKTNRRNESRRPDATAADDVIADWTRALMLPQTVQHRFRIAFAGEARQLLPQRTAHLITKPIGVALLCLSFGRGRRAHDFRTHLRHDRAVVL